MTIRILSKDDYVRQTFCLVKKLDVVPFNNSIILTWTCYCSEPNKREGYKLKEDESFQVVQNY